MQALQRLLPKHATSGCTAHVDGNNLHVGLCQRRPQEEPANAPKAINLRAATSASHPAKGRCKGSLLFTPASNLR